MDRAIVFTDLTGEGKDDAVVTVHSGGSAGRIALYVFSAGTGTDLKIAYRNQRLYRAEARVASGPQLVYSVPMYDAGDDVCCPSAFRETALKWSASKKKFGVASRRTVKP